MAAELCIVLLVTVLDFAEVLNADDPPVDDVPTDEDPTVLLAPPELSTCEAAILLPALDISVFGVTVLVLLPFRYFFSE